MTVEERALSIAVKITMQSEGRIVIPATLKHIIENEFKKDREEMLAERDQRIAALVAALQLAKDYLAGVTPVHVHEKIRAALGGNKP